MKKVGIVTITGGANYGNRLQNYAMQTVLKKLGYNPYTIRKADEKQTIGNILKKCVKHCTHYKYTTLDKRIEEFEKFNKKYINFSKKYIVSDDYNVNLCNEFDGFVCGSDQIWNPNYKMNTGSHFLSFAKNKKKIAVAASFGVDKITQEDEGRFSVWINELDAISVRENSGKEICKNITDKKVQVLIDPTLTLSSEEWNQIAEKPKNITNDKYIFCYLLGKYDAAFTDRIKEYADEQNKKVVFLEDIWRKSGIASDREFIYGPSEFVWLIKNSDLVITDSFHATVFSIIFNKRFLVVPREKENNDMSSRFVSLFDMFDIKNHIYNSEEDFDFAGELNHEKIDVVLKEEKVKFYEFVKNNL